MSPLVKSLPLVALGFGLGLGLAWFRTAPAPAADSGASTSASATRTAPASSPIATERPLARATAPGPAAASASPAETNQIAEAASSDTPPPGSLEPEARAKVIEQIEAAYVSYRPEALPQIAPFLSHADPEVRAFAREAVVQVGHAEGVPLLRGAAKKARDPREAAALLDAAEYLELPPATPVAAGGFKRNSPSATPAARRL